MKILVLTFYYWPDLCAGSFRATALVKELLNLPEKPTIEVLTTLPNRYATYTIEAPQDEKTERLSVRRFPIQKHRSGLVDQAVAFSSFVRAVKEHVKNEHYDLVFATSSRLMTAALGAYVARHLKTKLYLDIRDLFVDTIGDIFPSWMNLVAKPSFSMIEKWTFSYAERINIVSAGFTPYFSKKYPKKQMSCYSNGIDPEFITAITDGVDVAQDKAQLKRILYAGNIGEGQGLHRIIPLLAKKLQGSAEFIVMGDGGRKEVLEQALAEAQCKNVTLLPPSNRAELIEQYKKADVLFLHLNDYQAFHKVLPSKIFEYAAMGKPVLAGVAGFAAEFIKTEITNSAVFSPCDANGAIDALDILKYNDSVRYEFIEKYQRTKIMNALAKEIIAIG